jgi:hypothetical protein
MKPLAEQEILRHTARVFLAEARRRKGSGFARTLKQWACSARCKSHTKHPAPEQGELF